MRAPRGVTADLVGGKLRVPQRHHDQLQQPGRVGAAPVVVHPVVVGLDAQQAEFLVGRLAELLPAEPRHLREAQRRLGVVTVHVGQPRHGIVDTLADVFQRDGVEVHLVPVEPGGGDVPANGLDHVTETQTSVSGPLSSSSVTNAPRSHRVSPTRLRS
ncbi:MAG TPA: hypothetical protein VGP60_15145 [Amycolatopsis sp.]|nr:hypothetical protein [Amycolatopsis sp.]